MLITDTKLSSFDEHVRKFGTILKKKALKDKTILVSWGISDTHNARAWFIALKLHDTVIERQNPTFYEQWSFFMKDSFWCKMTAWRDKRGLWKAWVLVFLILFFSINIRKLSSHLKCKKKKKILKERNRLCVFVFLYILRNLALDIFSIIVYKLHLCSI